MAKLQFWTWNANKQEKKVFDEQSQNYLPLAVWSGQNASGITPKEIKACIIRKNVIKTLRLDCNQIEVLNNQPMFTKGNTDHNSVAVAVNWSYHDENMIATSASNGDVMLWNINTNKPIRCWKQEHKRQAKCLQWCPTEKNLLVSGSTDNTVRVWDIRQPSSVQVIDTKEGVCDLKYDPHDENQLACALSNTWLKLFDMRKPKDPRESISAHEGPVLKCDWNPIKKNVLATGGRKDLKVWNIEVSGKSTQNTSITNGDCAGLRWSPLDQNLLASYTLNRDDSVHLWDIRRRFRPFRTFSERAASRKGQKGNTSEQTNFITALHWQKEPDVLLSLSRDGVLVMHARKDAIDLEESSPPGAICTAPNGEITLALNVKMSRNQRQENAEKKIKRIIHHGHSVPNTVLEKAEPALTNQLGAMEGSEYVQPQSNHFIYQNKGTIEGSRAERFKFLALNYKLEMEDREDEGNENVFEHNAKVAESQGMLQVAQSWRILRVLSAEEVVVQFYETPDNHRREHRAGTGNFSDSALVSSDEDTEYDVNPPHEASDEEPFLFNEEKQWEMVDEAFIPQHNLNPESMELEEPSDKSSIGGDDLSYAIDTNQDDINIVRQSRTEMKNDFGSVTQEMLESLVREGEVQSAVTMVVALGNKIKKHTDQSFEQLTIPWFYRYNDLLSRFRLWTVQAAVIKKGPERIQVLNNKSLIQSLCAKCGNAIPVKNVSVCEKCGPTAMCGICRQTVNGLYMWCQGCQHGGHLNHMRDWFSKFQDCPAACGHKCEFGTG